jgi:signal transduction histidine kinase/ActR/RegA family two-component response regulator
MQGTDGPASAHSKRHRSLLGRSGLRLHHLLFLAFTIVAAVPTIVLAIWESNRAFQNELDSVRERHLLVARNLTSTMSHYAQDVRAVFAMAFESGAYLRPVPGVAELLVSLHVVHLCTIAPDGSLETRMAGLQNDMAPRLDPETHRMLRDLAATATTKPIISHLVRNRKGVPVLMLVKVLPEGRLGLGVLATDYLVSLQQAIAFGDNGHAVITDAKGQVIAHPFKDWTAASRDISGVPVVAAMKRGETGVGQFYSPAFKGDMIAGYTVVPETGWGVMVPQPIAELKQRASQVAEMALVIALTSFAIAALMSWLLALYLARPVRVVAATAEAVLDGNEDVSVPAFRGWVPHDLRRLGQAFNTMLDGLRRKAAETRKALRQAEASNEAKSQFLANMSHEIRTPLNGVVGMVELLRLTELTPDQRRYTEQAMQASQSLLRLIDDILDLSKIEAGRMELERVPFHLPTLMHDIRLLFADRAREQGLMLEITLPAELDTTLSGDPRRLSQVLTNLIGNAIKFTARGRITVTVSRVPDPRSEVLLRFEVADTGIGIADRHQAVIFDAFTQADSSTTRRFGGTGLGLSIARQLVVMMGGEIGVRSVPDAGATFWFTVRLDYSDQPATVEAKPTSAPVADAAATDAPFVPAAGRDFQATLRQAGRDRVRIMLVEDNPANMRVTRALLETLGCEVVAAENGRQAVAHYQADRFDLVLMDCQMPEMDGYEATRAIRRIEATTAAHTPIVALTAHAMEGSRETSLAAGMDDQLTKPLTMAALTAMLLAWLVPAEAGAGGETGAAAKTETG